MRTVKIGPMEYEIVETEYLLEGHGASVTGTEIKIKKDLPLQQKNYHLMMCIVSILDKQNHLKLSMNKRMALGCGLLSLLKDNTSLLETE